MLSLTLYAGNTMLLRAEGLADGSTGERIADALVTATLTPKGDETAVWTGTLEPTAVAGDYEVEVPDSLEVQVGDQLDGELVASVQGVRLRERLRVNVRPR